MDKTQAIKAGKSVRKERYFQAKGGRKTSTAVARLYTKTPGTLSVNGKDYKEYFKSPRYQAVAIAPMELMKVLDKVSASVHVHGGGATGQSEAVRNAIARALVEFNADFRKRLRRHEFLTRDSRMVERKKFGLKKARKAPQWAKR